MRADPKDFLAVGAGELLAGDFDVFLYFLKASQYAENSGALSLRRPVTTVLTSLEISSRDVLPVSCGYVLDASEAEQILPLKALLATSIQCTQFTSVFRRSTGFAGTVRIVLTNIMVTEGTHVVRIELDYQRLLSHKNIYCCS